MPTAYAAGIGRDIIHIVRHDVTEFGVDEVMYLDLLGAA
jgi:hypothetical protein